MRGSPPQVVSAVPNSHGIIPPLRSDMEESDSDTFQTVHVDDCMHLSLRFGDISTIVTLVTI